MCALHHCFLLSASDSILPPAPIYRHVLMAEQTNEKKNWCDFYDILSCIRGQQYVTNAGTVEGDLQMGATRAEHADMHRKKGPSNVCMKNVL